MENKVPVRWMLVILLGAFLLRGFNLGGKSLWFDEAFSVNRATQEAMARLVFVDRGHPPLHFTALHHWIAVFGSSETVVRLLSGFVSMLSVALIYALGRALLDRRAGLAAAALLALSSLDVWYAQEARMYIFVTFSGLLFALGLVWQGWPGGLLSFVGLSLGLYFDYLMIPLWVGISAAWAVLWWQRGRPRGAFLQWLLASAGAWLLYVPWFPYLRQMIEDTLTGVFVLERVRILLGLQGLAVLDLLVVMALAALAIFLGGMLLTRWLTEPRRRLLFAMTLLVLFAVATALFTLPRAYSLKRILVTGWPFIILAAAWSLSQLGSKERPIRIALFGLSLVTAVIMLIAVPKDDWRGVTSYVNQLDVDPLTIWIDPPYNSIAYDYYTPRHQAVPIRPQEPKGELATGQTDIWLIAGRAPGEPIPSSSSEAWLDQHWRLVDSVPFYRLELRHYRPR